MIVLLYLYEQQIPTDSRTLLLLARSRLASRLSLALSLALTLTSPILSPTLTSVRPLLPPPLCFCQNAFSPHSSNIAPAAPACPLAPFLQSFGNPRAAHRQHACSSAISRNAVALLRRGFVCRRGDNAVCACIPGRSNSAVVGGCLHRNRHVYHHGGWRCMVQQPRGAYSVHRRQAGTWGQQMPGGSHSYPEAAVRTQLSVSIVGR